MEKLSSNLAGMFEADENPYWGKPVTDEGKNLQSRASFIHPRSWKRFLKKKKKNQSNQVRNM